MHFKNILTTLALATTTLAAPVEVNGTALEARAANNKNHPPVPIGINLWGSSHEDCQHDPHKTDLTFPGLQYNQPATVDKAFTSFSLSRALAQNEHIEFYAPLLNDWTGEPEGSPCAILVGSVDWTLHAWTCGQVNYGTEAGAYCVKLIS